MMTITTWVIYLAPVGVFFLIGGQVLEMADFNMVAGQLGLYFTTVLVGLGLHGFVVLPILFTICTRTMPFRFIANMTNAFTTAFGTASSSATLPVTIKLLEEKNGVDPRIARYVISNENSLGQIHYFTSELKIFQNDLKLTLPWQDFDWPPA